MSQNLRSPWSRVARALVCLLLLPVGAVAVDMDNDGMDASVDPNDRVPRYHVSAAGSHACALDDRGVHCWGSNSYGIANVPALSRPFQVDAGGTFVCAIDDGRVLCWGDNSLGQLDVPPELENPVQVSSGLSHACALHDGGVSCWGNNGNNQTQVPTLVEPVYVSAGGRHTCALDDTGMVCWGDNNRGQAPASVAYMAGARQIVTGREHTCGLHDTGINCWGSNTDGQTNIPTALRPVATGNPYRLSAGDFHTCALHAGGAQCWGRTVWAESLATPPALSNPKDIASGSYHSCALNDGQVVCWGSGQLADRGAHILNALAVPDQVSGSGQPSSPLCGIVNNSVVCWGRSNENQLSVPALSNPQTVQVGNRFACALHDNGVACWGTSAHGTLTVPALSAPSQLAVHDGYVCVLDNGVPVCWGAASSGRTLPPAITGMTHLAATQNRACAWNSSAVECWGANGSGQAGSHVLGDVSSVAFGGSHTCALGEAGVSCWGSNTYNQRTVPALSNPVLVATGSDHSCAVDDDGVRCWGRNHAGQTAAPALSNPRELVAANHYSCALDDHGATCWGNLADGLDLAPADSSLRDLVTFNGTACAIGDSGLHCWGALAQRQAFAASAPLFNDLDGDLVPDHLDPAPADPTVSGTLVADAGGPYIGVQNVAFALDGSASWTDNDGITLSHYRWDQDDSDGVSFAEADATGVAASVLYPLPGDYTLTLQVTDSVGRTALATTSVEILSDRDGDGVPDIYDAFPDHASASVDADGDGYPDDCVSAEACLADGLTPDPSLDDFDNDGIKTADDEDDTRDTNPATVTPPPDIAVIATGAETEIDLLQGGMPYAVDFPNVVLDALPQTEGHSTSVMLPSGRHQIDWCAVDAADNVGCSTQVIDITPLVLFERQEQTVAKGALVEVLVALSGNPISYPVVIPVLLDEDSSTGISGQDHDAETTAVIINAHDPDGDLEPNTGRFTFFSLNDGITGEPAKTVNFLLTTDNGVDEMNGAALGDEASRHHSVTITEANLPPVVTLTAAATIPLASGMASFAIDINDPNTHETFFVAWYLNDVLIASGNNLTQIDHSLLDAVAGTYTLRVTVLDDGSPAQEGEDQQLITFVAAAANGSSSGGVGQLWILAMLLLAARTIRYSMLSARHQSGR
jgi:alpha-tubulin suppressor-like RCC1 family protein